MSLRNAGRFTDIVEPDATDRCAANRVIDLRIDAGDRDVDMPNARLCFRPLLPASARAPPSYCPG